MKNTISKYLAAFIGILTLAALAPAETLAENATSEPIYGIQQNVAAPKISFEEFQAKILLSLEMNIQRLNKKKEVLNSITDITDNVKAEILKIIDLRITAINSLKDKIKQATTREELLQLRQKRFKLAGKRLNK
jgi:hypothetical protein